MILINRILPFIGLWFVTLIVSANEPGFTIANTLQSNMVVQREKPLVVWGKASPGAKIKVKADWQDKIYEAVTSPAGEWKAVVPVPGIKPGDYKGHSVTIYSGTSRITLSNILFGDVWLCSGQSNMDMTIKPFLPWLLGALHIEQEIENANYPQIRLFDVRTDFKAIPQSDCGGVWKICSPATAGDFSALAYFFAREIFNRTKIPIGLITSAVGASSCQAWTGRDSLTADTVLFNKYLYPYDTSSHSKESLDSVVTFEKVVRPTLFYNAMIHPLKNIQLSGALWYQGESNKDDGALYTRLCGAMIGNWRQLFGNKELPFYYVQVAPYDWQVKDSTLFNYALLREAQSKIREVAAYTGMAVTMDIADPADIHPRNKQDLGYRLAKIALAEKYKIPGTVYKGPEYERYTKEKDTLKIQFRKESIGSGLSTNDGLDPRYFFVAGKDSVFYYANARIVDNEVWVFSSNVKDPVAVRYAFTNYPVTNFANKDGFPAVPFRSAF